MTGREEDLPSKTRRKQEADALQALGVELARLPPETLAALTLPDRLRDALEALPRTRSREAQRRQRQYIGRLMRDVDVEPLQRAVEESRRPSREDARRFREVESWRDRLLAEGESSLDEFCRSHPAADRAALAATLAQAREGRAGAARRLFRELRRSGGLLD